MNSLTSFLFVLHRKRVLSIFTILLTYMKGLNKSIKTLTCRMQSWIWHAHTYYTAQVNMWWLNVNGSLDIRFFGRKCDSIAIQLIEDPSIAVDIHCRNNRLALFIYNNSNIQVWNYFSIFVFCYFDLKIQKNGEVFCDHVHFNNLYEIRFCFTFLGKPQSKTQKMQ